MADLHEHLTRVDLVIDVLAKGPFFDVVGEGFDDFEVNVSLKQSNADFLKHLIHVLLGETRLATQFFEDGAKAVG